MPGNAAVRADYLENLKTDPFFRREPEALFEAGGETFAGGTVGDYESVLDIDTDLDISQVKVVDYLLAKAFPSRTGPMGSAENKEWPPQGVNFDMFTDFRTDANAWPEEDSDDNKIWKHSDWKNVPYVHVYKLFEKFTGKEN